MDKERKDPIYTREKIKEIIKAGSVKEKIQVLAEYTSTLYTGEKPLLTERDLDRLYKSTEGKDEAEFNAYVELLNTATERRDAMYLFAQRMFHHSEKATEIIKAEQQALLTVQILNSHLKEFRKEEITTYIEESLKSDPNLIIKPSKGWTKLTFDNSAMKAQLKQRAKAFNEARYQAKTIVLSYEAFVKENGIEFLIPSDIRFIMQKLKADYHIPPTRAKDIHFNSFEESEANMEVINSKPFNHE